MSVAFKASVSGFRVEGFKSSWFTHLKLCPVATHLHLRGGPSAKIVTGPSKT